MARSIVVTGVQRSAKGIYVRFDDGEELEFTNRADMREYVRDVINDVSVARLLKAIAVARAVRVGADSDTADDLDTLVNKTITFNRNAANNILRIA